MGVLEKAQLRNLLGDPKLRKCHLIHSTPAHETREEVTPAGNLIDATPAQFLGWDKMN